MAYHCQVWPGIHQVLVGTGRDWQGLVGTGRDW